MAVATLTRRDLNRATLARQMLLVREKLTATRAIERLLGLQAQLARPPFVALWSRLEGFRREDLARALAQRAVIRATTMRATLHLMSAKDYLALRATFQPAFTQVLSSVLKDRARRLDLEAVIAAARACFAERSRTFDELRALLMERFPKGDERAMGYAVRLNLPLVQVPTEAEWSFPGSADFTLAESWIGRPPAAAERPGDLVLRYLAAFGPATAADAQNWSGVRGLSAALEGSRPKLRVFRDERGKELFDLPKAPRPAGDTPAPVRFLPEFDSLVLGHADRSRLVADQHRPALTTPNLQIPATFLVDGFVAGTWKVERKRAAAALSIEPFDALSKRTREELLTEGEQLLRFVERDAGSYEVRFAGRRAGAAVRRR